MIRILYFDREEFKCTCGETFFIVYVNAETGAEEELFEVLNSDEGDLVV